MGFLLMQFCVHYVARKDLKLATKFLFGNAFTFPVLNKKRERLEFGRYVPRLGTDLIVTPF